MAITGMTGMGDTQTEIAKMYQQYLGRQPDQGGLDYYSGLASSGGSMDSILDSIANSPEAKRFRESSQSAVKTGLLAGRNISNPTNPGNVGPVLSSTNMANPDFAAGQQGDTVGGIGNTSGMGQDINWSAPTTSTLSVGQVFSTPAGDYQAVDNGFGQIGLAAMDGAAQGPNDIIYNMAYGNNHFGVNPNTGEAWYQEAQGTVPSLYDSSPVEEVPAAVSATPQASNLVQTVSLEQVNELYNEFLGRNGNRDYMQAWVDTGLSINELAAAISGSPEGQAFAEAQAASSSRHCFVRHCFVRHCFVRHDP